ncbi:MAG: hypothetical protein FRX48_04277 [Lasallia pustulata]|uniref:Uncharacterized protein n=1 Tax=Lasallia pustulata TaxID=136370 RepID=A0A5M8PRT3_9LECA|nr:MAG: hypothetical protein FRX48_04277 [Lasallia pustulata]
MEYLKEYEAKRQRNIQRNRALLRDLELTSTFAPTTAPKAAKVARKPRPPSRAVQEAPRSKSTRLANKLAGIKAPDGLLDMLKTPEDEESSQFALKQQRRPKSVEATAAKGPTRNYAGNSRAAVSLEAALLSQPPTEGEKFEEDIGEQVKRRLLSEEASGITGLRTADQHQTQAHQARVEATTAKGPTRNYAGNSRAAVSLEAALLSQSPTEGEKFDEDIGEQVKRKWLSEEASGTTGLRTADQPRRKAQQAQYAGGWRAGEDTPF